VHGHLLTQQFVVFLLQPCRLPGPCRLGLDHATSTEAPLTVLMCGAQSCLTTLIPLPVRLTPAASELLRLAALPLHTTPKPKPAAAGCCCFCAIVPSLLLLGAADEACAASATAFKTVPLLLLWCL
jgi:hypothetical protein